MIGAPPPRVLLAWQHGANLGHVARLGALGRHVAELGAEPVWAVPERYLQLAAWQVRADREPCERVAVPDWPTPAADEAMHSFADVLANLGYTDANLLQASVSQWLICFEQLRIDRVILDYAPAAQLAAALAGLPAMQVTNGFDGPPPACPIFGIDVRGPMLERRNERRIAQLDRCFADVGHAMGFGAAPSFRQVLAYPLPVHDCLPETDPYDPRGGEGHYVGALGEPEGLAAIDWPSGARDAAHVLAYLRAEAQLDSVLEALTNHAFGVGAQVICICPTATPPAIARWQRAGVQMSRQPVDLKHVMPACDLVVSYGAVALTCHALLAGKPQLLLPADAEKWLMAQRVARTGAASTVDARSTAAQIAAAARPLLSHGAARQAAEAIASRHRDIGAEARVAVQRFLGASGDTKRRWAS